MVILLLGGLAFWSQALAGDPPGNKYVRVVVAIADSTVAPGGHSDILITLTPIEGIHINADPAPEFLIDPAGVAKTIGKVRVTTERDVKLASDKPMHQEIAIAPGTPPGEHTVKGTFTYYYCSDSEGWCMRYRQAVALTVIVRN